MIRVGIGMSQFLLTRAKMLTMFETESLVYYNSSQSNNSMKLNMTRNFITKRNQKTKID